MVTTSVGDIIGGRNNELDITLLAKKGKDAGKVHVKLDK